MLNKTNKPLLLIISAPSGGGKSTLCDRLVDRLPGIAYSISCTTRAPRGKERDGEDYHFLSVEEFEERAQRGEFLEQAIVHGNRYGTLRKPVEDAMRAGESVLMDIDVQGAAQIREKAKSLPPGHILAQGFVDIFIRPPSIEVLRQRLERRGEDAPDVVAKRIRNAEMELARAGEYRYGIVNDDLDQAYRELESIVRKEWQS